MPRGNSGSLLAEERGRSENHGSIYNPEGKSAYRSVTMSINALFCLLSTNDIDGYIPTNLAVSLRRPLLLHTSSSDFGRAPDDEMQSRMKEQHTCSVD